MGHASSRGFAQGRPTCAPPAQTLQVRKGQDADPLEQYPPSPAGYGGTGVWDLRYIDAPVLRWREGEEVPKYIGPHNSPTEFHLYYRGRPWPRRGRNVVDTGRDSFEIHVPVGSRSEWEYGNYDARGKARKAPHWRVTAHELCGHAWKEHHQTGGRMPLDILHISDRGRPMFEQPGRRPHHDRAVGVENEIARQVDPEGEGKHPRPLYDQHDLHGESLGRDKDAQWDVKTDPQTGEAYPKPDPWINE